MDYKEDKINEIAEEEVEAEDNIGDIFKATSKKLTDQGKAQQKEQKKFKESSLFEDNDEAEGTEDVDSFENIISKVRSHKCEQKFRVQRVLKTKKYRFQIIGKLQKRKN